MEHYTVFTVDLKSNIQRKIEITADEAETTENIVLQCQIDSQEIMVSDYHYFPAYQKLRDKLIKFGYGLLCNGSKLNAVQSGMMGANEKVYLVSLGKQALPNDIVSLWAYADINNFPNTQEQTAFFTKWCASLKNKP